MLLEKRPVLDVGRANIVHNCLRLMRFEKGSQVFASFSKIHNEGSDGCKSFMLDDRLEYINARLGCIQNSNQRFRAFWSGLLVHHDTPVLALAPRSRDTHTFEAGGRQRYRNDMWVIC